MNQYVEKTTTIEGVEEVTNNNSVGRSTQPVENHPQHGVSPKKYAKPSNKLGSFVKEITQGTSNFLPYVMWFFKSSSRSLQIC